MSSLNKVMLIGNVGKDVELKATVNGVKYAYVSLATTEVFKDKKTGEKKENTTWHNIKVYENFADIFAKYIKKGAKIYVEGSIKYNEYEKDGQKTKNTEIVVKNFLMLDKAQIKNEDVSSQMLYKKYDLVDDEIPF